MAVLDEARGDLAPLGGVRAAGARRPRRARARAPGFGAARPRAGRGPAGDPRDRGGPCGIRPREARTRSPSGRISSGSADASRAEVVLSGPGLFRLAEALAALAAIECPFTMPNDVCSPPREGDPLATEALDMFARLLGRFAGDLALTFEASGGVFIAGGIAPRMVDILQAGELPRRLRPQGAARALGAQVPAYVIVNPEPALHGLAALVADPERFVFQSQGWSCLPGLSRRAATRIAQSMKTEQIALSPLAPGRRPRR